MRIHGVPDFDIRLLVLLGERAAGPDGLQYPLEMRLRFMEDLRDTVRSMVEKGARRFLLDLEKTTYLDSAALGCLVSCYKRANEAGGEVALLRPVGRVRAVIQLVQFDQIFRLFDDEAAAIAALTT